MYSYIPYRKIAHENLNCSSRWKTGGQLPIITGYIRSYQLHPLITPTCYFQISLVFSRKLKICVNQRPLRNQRLKNLVNPVILSKKFVLICVYQWFRFFSRLHFATWRLCGKQSRLKSVVSFYFLVLVLSFTLQLFSF